MFVKKTLLQIYLSGDGSLNRGPSSSDRQERARAIFLLDKPVEGDFEQVSDRFDQQLAQQTNRARWGHAEADALMQAIIDLDVAMAEPCGPRPSLRFALDHPMGMAGLDIAKQAFRGLSDCVAVSNDKSRAVPVTPAWEHLARSVDSARRTLGSIGFDRSQADALLDRAFTTAMFAMVPSDDTRKTTQTLRALASFVTDSDDLGGMSSILGSNAVTLSLAVGEVGSWSFDQGMAFGYPEAFDGVGRYAMGPKVLDWANSVLNGLEHNLDFDEPELIDMASLKKISALVAFSDQFKAVFDRAFPRDASPGERHPLGGSFPRVRALAEKFECGEEANVGRPGRRPRIDEAKPSLGDKIAKMRSPGEPGQNEGPAGTAPRL